MADRDDDIELELENETQPEDNVFLELSDEEFLSKGQELLAPSQPAAAAAEGGAQTGASTETDDDKDDDDGEQDPAKGEQAEIPPDTKPEDTPVKGEGDQGKDADAAAAGEGDSPKTGEEAPPAVDYETEYKKLLAPFRANGKDMQVDNVDDAIRLMQLGANYNKKMAAMKPGLRVLKMLEKANLLDEQKLGFLIDVEKKSPEAIAKLVKDSGINPLDIDVQKESNYKPSTNHVDDVELELDSVLEELKESAHYSKLLDVVSAKWDGNSQKIVANNPNLLKVIEGHMASGVYDLISTAVERDKTLGKYRGLSDLEAYRAVGDALNAKGAFDHLFKKEQSPPPPVQKPTKDAKQVKDQRRAASPTQTAAPSKQLPADFNPLSMSDEEFSSKMMPKLL